MANNTTNIDLENKVRASLYTRGGSALRNQAILADMLSSVAQGNIEEAILIIFEDTFAGNADLAAVGFTSPFSIQLKAIAPLVETHRNRESW